jgi:tRNA A37 threonylcarbamoyladenosine biosynthesis protein TsaE
MSRHDGAEAESRQADAGAESRLVLQCASGGPGDTRAAGCRLGKMLRHGDTVMLHGGVGAGKTVFVGGIALALGVREPVTSPTYTFSNTYEGAIERGASGQSGACGLACAGDAGDSGGVGGAGNGVGSAVCCAGGVDSVGNAGDSGGAACAGYAGCAGGMAGGAEKHGQSAKAALCHFDVYRLDDPDGAVEIGLADSMGDAGGVTVVEWAENISPYYPPAYYDVFISKTEDWNDDRQIVIRHVGRGSGGQH